MNNSAPRVSHRGAATLMVDPKAKAPGLFQGPNFVFKIGGPFGNRTQDTRIKRCVYGVLFYTVKYGIRTSCPLTPPRFVADVLVSVVRCSEVR